jgi:hypothetical protein
LNGRRETAKEMKWSFGFSRCKSFLVCVLQRSSTIKPKAAHYNKLKKSEKKTPAGTRRSDRSVWGAAHPMGFFFLSFPNKNKLPNYFCFCVAV